MSDVFPSAKGPDWGWWAYRFDYVFVVHGVCDPHFFRADGGNIDMFVHVLAESMPLHEQHIFWLVLCQCQEVLKAICLKDSLPILQVCSQL